jgi:membrane-associated phospholipid phosphatase
VSVAGELEPPAAKAPGRRRFLANVREGLALLQRPPRAPFVCPAWRAPARLALGALLWLAITAGTMVLIDAPIITAVASLPDWVGRLFNVLTDFGTSDWFLVPIGLALMAIAALASPALVPMSRLVVAALTLRLGFLFAAIALPGLFVTIVKRLIGRARPFIGGHADPFLYVPFGWQPEYASLPSGHATNVFAALLAVGLLWPRLRPVMLVYALIIAASRVIVLAHHPSDVIAGAVVGTVGALLVRDWFASRRLAFAIDAGGGVRTLPGPSLRRLARVARQIVAAS